MAQLTEDQIDELRAKCIAWRPEKKNTIWFSHCEDGAYDDLKSKTRYFIYGGFHYYVISKMWIEDEVGNKRLDPWEQAPWGTYPDIPPKPPKT